MKYSLILQKMAILFGVLGLYINAFGQAKRLEPFKNVIWKNQDTLHTDIAKFFIDSAGSAVVYYHSFNTPGLKTRHMKFDHYLNDLAIFKDCDRGQCMWLSILTNPSEVIAAHSLYTGANFNYDSAYHIATRPGKASPCPPDCSSGFTVGQLSYFSSISCCINKDHAPRHCGKNMNEMAELYKKNGCIFD